MHDDPDACDYRHQAREAVKGIGRPAMLARRLSICGLTAEIIVYAQDDAEARAKAVHQLRVRGLKV